ncbi:4Fe-4S binding protein [Syntrophomonas erecta]
MKEILFISGKGGTGKTSLTASFIHLAKNCTACDYDVDASNLPILLKPKEVQAHFFSGGKSAILDRDKCIQCDLCIDLCRFDAIHDYSINPLFCEGCGLCSRVCPVEAINMKPNPSGRWFEGESGSHFVYYAKLRPGEENSGKLVAQVKAAARARTKEAGIPLIVADGPPGIGCPVISSLVEVDLVVLVAEPSLSGFHDLQRIHHLVRSRGIREILIINKWDINPKKVKQIEKWAVAEEVPCVGKIPFDAEIASCIANTDNPAANPRIKAYLEPIWEQITAQLMLQSLPKSIKIKDL